MSMYNKASRQQLISVCICGLLGECGNFKVVYTPVSVTDMSLEYVCSDKECAFFWKQKDELAVEADMI